MIQKNYLNNIHKIKSTLQKEEIIILKEFFTKEYYNELKEEIQKLNFTKEKQPLLFSYSKSIIKLPTEIIDFFFKITNTRPTTLTAYKFKWKDYTLLHDSIKQNNQIEILIDLTGNWNQGAGGQLHYHSKDAIIPVKGNSITIVTGNIVRYVKYINYLSKKDRVLIIATD